MSIKPILFVTEYFVSTLIVAIEEAKYSLFKDARTLVGKVDEFDC